MGSFSTQNGGLGSVGSGSKGLPESTLPPSPPTLPSPGLLPLLPLPPLLVEVPWPV